MNGLEHLAIVVGACFAGSVVVGMLLVVTLPLLRSMLLERRYRTDQVLRRAPQYPVAR